MDGTIDNKEILEIPEGEYLCFQCKPFSDIHNLKEFFNKLKEDYGEEHLGLIYAMVVVFHISDWQEEVFEIQIEYKS